MKKIFSIILTASVCVPFLTSCIEEIDPQTSYVTEEQMANAPGVFDNYVASLTDGLVGEFLYNNDSGNMWDFGYPTFFITRDVEGQDIIPVNYGAYSSWYQNFTYLAPGWAVTQLPITVYYKWIKDINLTINMAGATGYAQPKERHEVGAGIAYAMRAMHYLDLVRMFANEPYYQNPQAPTTVKITETTTIDESRNNPRMTWEQAFDFILRDLDEAEKLLANYERTDVYTPDLSVVYGLKARTYLEKRDWANAELYAKKAQEGYTMMSKEEYMSRDYGFNTPTSSWMFATQYKDTDPNILDNDGDSSWGSMMIMENGFECGMGAFYGYPMVIDRHLYETIPATDFRKGLFVDFAIDDMTSAEAAQALTAYSDHPAQLLTSASAAEYGPGGFNLKFRPQAGKYDVKYTAWVVSVPLMRVEEMKLIEAEAAGMQDLNRGIQLLTAFAKTRDAAYEYGKHNEAYGNATTPAFQNEVWWQRRVELWGEGFATFDIKRLGKGIIRSYPNSNHVEGCRFNTTSIPGWMNWCFVGTEADNNKALVNNPDPVRPEGDSPEHIW